jgi:DNA-binding response OmpR family regulator
MHLSAIKQAVQKLMEKILFVEDEQAVQKTFGESLSNAGYEVVSALNGEIGFDLAKKEKPDLILLDLILPKVHGLEVLERLKKDKETKNIPVIILTNIEGAEEVDKALELGAIAYLVKTAYHLDELLGKVKGILEGRKEQ